MKALVGLITNSHETKENSYSIVFLLISGQAIFSQQLTLTKLEELCLSTQLEVSSKYLIKEGWGLSMYKDSVVRNGTVTILKPVSTFDLNCSIFSVNNLP